MGASISTVVVVVVVVTATERPAPVGLACFRRARSFRGLRHPPFKFVVAAAATAAARDTPSSANDLEDAAAAALFGVEDMGVAEGDASPRPNKRSLSA
eukprot:CAMPEP_0171733216 /NCGR_PEP_ID=MMETSP0991-20121206/30127_1 /TAXON_ID=483369 /ORGANISM="non described non described, Strain CCMP2098" /LENGTH=97 /DNA_ID=CAMNT_0012328843 /DNA_START=35 /DNA_END=329 /DNA_ORIENTATION=+